MKYIFILIMFALSISLYGQKDYVYIYTDNRSDKVIDNIKAKEDSIKEIIKKYDKLIELNSKDAKAWFMKATNEENLAHLTDNYTDANHAYAKVTKLGSEYADTAYYRIGRISYYLSYGLLVRGHTNFPRVESFYQDFVKATEINPKYGDAYYQRGLFEEKYNKAIECLTKAIEYSIQYKADAYCSRGNLKLKKDKEGACDDWNKAADLGIYTAKQYLILNCSFIPKTAEDFYDIAYLKQLKDSKGAIENLNKAIELNPKYGAAYLLRGSIKYKRDKEGACVDWKKAVELGSNVAKDYLKDYGCK